VVVAMKNFVKAAHLRLLLTVMTIAGSALVLEAGQRWHP